MGGGWGVGVIKCQLFIIDVPPKKSTTRLGSGEESCNFGRSLKCFPRYNIFSVGAGEELCDFESQFLLSRVNSFLSGTSLSKSVMMNCCGPDAYVHEVISIRSPDISPDWDVSCLRCNGT